MAYPSLEQLQDVDTLISLGFAEGLKLASDDLNLIATTFTSNKRKNVYPFKSAGAQVREWLGDRVLQGVDHFEKYELENRHWEVTIRVPVDDILDDEYGFYVQEARDQASKLVRHKSRLCFEALRDGAEADALCYDGMPFFSDAHPVGDGTQSNYTTGDKPAWCLIDDTGLKPIVFQMRQEPVLTPKNMPTDDNMFFEKTSIWGADMRCAAGYGLWQTAHMSRLELNETNLDAAAVAMQELTDANGEPLGITPTLLVVGPRLRTAAMKLLSATTMANGATNVLQGLYKLHVSPYFV